MKKLNIPLVVGLIIVLGIIFLIFFGEYYAPYDPSAVIESKWVIKENGERVFMRSPFMPDKDHIFGTDNAGRDVLSIIMAGAKNTFFIVFLATLLRFLVAIPIAFLAAFGERISKGLITIFSSTFSAVPSLLICIMILKADAIKNLELQQSMLAFIIVFTVVGWGRLASVIEDKIRDVLNQDFIQGSIAIGKSKFAIATQNVTAHIMPWLVVYTFLEIALVLLLLAQLGIFEVFIGNKQVFTIKQLGGISRSNYSYFPEWGSMLASTKRSIFGNRFWLSLFPLLAFSVSIVGFNLLGEGLSLELNKRNSMFISYVNKFWFHLSPLTYIGEIKHFKEKQKIVAIKTTIIVAVIAIIVVPIFNSISIGDNAVMAHVMDINDDIYGGRLIGTSGHEEFADYIVSQLKEYNITPLFNDSYISEFKVDPTINIINDSKFVVRDDSGETVNEFKYKSDYYLETWTSNSIHSIEGEILTVEDYLDSKFDLSKEYFLLLNTYDSQISIYDSIVSEQESHIYIKGVLVPDLKERNFSSQKTEIKKRGLTRILDKIETFSEDAPPVKIIIGKTAHKKLKELSGNKLTIDVNIDNHNGLVGKNIGGIIEGKSSENPIIIGTSYDYLGTHDSGHTVNFENIITYKGLYENGTSIAGSLELARNLGDVRKAPDRSIIFLFIDGSQITIQGIKDIEKYNIFDKEPLLIYLKYMGITKWGKTENNIYHNTLLNKDDSSMEQEFYRWIRRNSTKTEAYITVDNQIRERSLFTLDDKDMVGIIFQGLKETEKTVYYGTVQDKLDAIDVEGLTTHIQVLLDSILDMAYGGKRWIR